MRLTRYTVIGPHHGECKTLWYVHDRKLDEWIESFDSRVKAENRCLELMKGIENNGVHEVI
jgi:hypothetical protein